MMRPLLCTEFGKPSYYNAVRPHRAKGRMTPRAAFDARAKAGPREVTEVVTKELRVRHAASRTFLQSGATSTLLTSTTIHETVTPDVNGD